MAIFYKLEGLAGPMASKKGGTGKRFQFPKFEREAFLEKEVRDAKVSFISLGLASVMVIISLVLATSVHVGPAILIGFMGPFALYFLIPAAGIDTSEFERKNWFGPGMITFFAWLGLFILLSNPPFQDLADPTIDHFKVYQQDPDSGNWTRLETPANNTYTVTNGTFVIVLRIMDNWQLDRYGITLEGAATGVDSAVGISQAPHHTAGNKNRQFTRNLHLQIGVPGDEIVKTGPMDIFEHEIVVTAGLTELVDLHDVLMH